MADVLYYLYSFVKGIPVVIIEISFLLTLCSVVIIFAISNNLITVRKWVMTSILVEYLYLVVCSTVVFREEATVAQYNFLPFWTYTPMLKGDTVYIKESLMNIALGFPIGVLVSVIVKRSHLLKAILFGLLFSFLIEILQYCYRRGLSEFDDMFHNTLGCLLGYSAFYMTTRIIRKIRTQGR